MSTQFHVTQEAFSGPLDLLLALIEKRKLLINDIALAEVTDDFLRYVEQHPEYPVAETANFILIGSTLLLIKSKSLLPILALTDEETVSIEELELRLKKLELFKRVALEVADQFNKQPLFSRRPNKRRPVEFSPDGSMTKENLEEAIRRVLNNLPDPTPRTPQVTVDRVISLEEMVTRLTERMNSALRSSFRDFASMQGEGKVNIVVSFLAMLELVKQGIIRVEQRAHFEDITMEQDALGVPHYG